MKRLTLALAILALTGCGTLDSFTLENRIACAVGGDKVFLVSEYGGWIGVSSVVSEKDAAKILQACKS